MDKQEPGADPAAATDEDDLRRHTRLHGAVSGCPLVEGNAVNLFPGARPALAAMFDAIAAAHDHVHLEYYTFEDVHLDGRSLFGLLRARLAAGLRVTIVYDAYGSQNTSQAQLEVLARAGAVLREFHPLNPLRRRFAWRVNDRDHRKILVADGRTAFLGGVNLARAYENPPAAGIPADGDTGHAFWRDAAIRIEGPVVAEVQKLFLATLKALGGEARGALFPELRPVGRQTVRVEGSAPRERRPLYNISLRVAVAAARRRILLSTGYFVPTHGEWKQLAEAAQRGVAVDLLLPGYSDVPATVAAARALYGRLLRRGVRIHEVRDGILHAKTATIDGVWTAIGSSNLDRRSVVYNNEVDAILLGHDTAAAVEAMLRRAIGEAETITLAGWRGRSPHERARERLARLWKRYM